MTLTAMRTRPPKELIGLGAVALSGYAGAVVTLGLSHGVGHRSNMGVMIALPLTLGAVATAACGLAALVCTCMAFRASSIRWRVAGLGVSVLCLLIPWPLSHSLPRIAAIAERRDFDEAGPQSLRAAARDLIHASAERDYPLAHLGSEVPSADVPAVIRAFAPPSARVTVNQDYVGLQTDGMGGWRGGYAIVPVESAFVPPFSHKIAEGFYYVTVQH